jgi:hypothetical protein
MRPECLIHFEPDRNGNFRGWGLQIGTPQISLTGVSSEPISKRTPLYGEHARLGAKIIGFGGWDMPVQYSGIIDEHQAVRTAVGVFDISHMGQFLAGCWQTMWDAWRPASASIPFSSMKTAA